MTAVTIDTYHEANRALKQKDLRQALYDEGAVLGAVQIHQHLVHDHRARRNVETQVFRRDFFRYYETEVFPRGQFPIDSLALHRPNEHVDGKRVRHGHVRRSMGSP